MTDAINAHNRVRNTPPATVGKEASPQASNSSTSSSASSSSVVDIKSTKLLEAMSIQMDKIPEIDSAKVDSIKLSIANGEYLPNADVIAQKFVEIEKLL